MAIAPSQSSSTAPNPVRPELPDGPSMSSMLQLLNWMIRPYPFLNDCVERYGDFFTMRLNSFCPIIFCSHPDDIQTIFKEGSNPAKFESGSTNGLLRPLVGDESILLLDGDRHQRQRQLMMPPFHGERMRTYGASMCEITRQTLDACTDQAPFSVRPVMQEISLKVILQTVFGIDRTSPQKGAEGDRYDQIQRQMTDLLDMTGSPLSSSLLFIRSLQKDWGVWSPWGKFVRKRASVDAMLYEEIESRRQNPDPDAQDILSLLLAARDEDGQPMTNVELRDELLTLLLAGHETTASAIAWAMYWIHRQPQVRDRLLTELQDADLSDSMAIARLPYLNAVCQETLRIYPIAPITFPRKVVNQPFELRGYSIPPENMLAPCVYMTHHRPDLYPNPEEFRPERFLERQYSPYEFIPFGGGNRRCLGMAFAQFEMKLVLATVLTEYELSLTSDRPLKPTRRGVTIAPPASFKMVAKTGKRAKLKS